MSSSASPSFYGRLRAPSALHRITVSFLRQSEDVASLFQSPFFNNVLESLSACSPHQLFICDMVAPRDAEDCTQAAAMEDI